MAHRLAETGTESIFRSGDYRRHWDPMSEVCAPVEVLLQYLRQGWEPDTPISVETFFLGQGHSEVYHFSLRRDGMFTEVPVLANPATLRIIELYRLALRHIGRSSVD
jgi:hypothetical protein